MEKDKQFFEDSFKNLDTVSKPTDEQKDRIYNGILNAVESNSMTQPKLTTSPFKNLVINYPWRFAFGAAFIQTSICTLIFGANYTHFILKILGG